MRLLRLHFGAGRRRLVLPSDDGEEDEPSIHAKSAGGVAIAAPTPKCGPGRPAGSTHKDATIAKLPKDLEFSVTIGYARCQR